MENVLIKVNPKALDDASAKIEESAKKYDKISKLLMDRATRMGNAWEGDDNQAFVKQISGLTEDLDSMVKKLKLVSMALNKQSDNYKKTQKGIIDNVKNLKN